MGRSRRTYWKQKRFIEGFVGKCWGNRPPGIPRCLWEDNINMGLQEVGCGLDWINLTISRNSTILRLFVHIIAIGYPLSTTPVTADVNSAQGHDKRDILYYRQLRTLRIAVNTSIWSNAKISDHRCSVCPQDQLSSFLSSRIWQLDGQRYCFPCPAWKHGVRAEVWLHSFLTSILSGVETIC